MANFWTEEQQKVIDLRNRNILVAAAAGSGKTAVLVERILKKITDPKHPVDIDRLLIVTFTRAAAAEMRERIGIAIRKKMEEEPDNENLQRQETLLFHAQITTIDSFCQSLLRSHFHTIDLDPSFSVMDEGEGKLLLYDTAQELLEERYAEKSEEFVLFAESFATGKQDDNLIDMILQLYHFSRSYPWPKEWLLGCKKAYQAESVEELEKSLWMQNLCQMVRVILGDLLEFCRESIQLALSSGGPWMYEEALCEDEALLMRMLEGESYQELSDGFFEMGKFAVLSRKKDDTVSEEKRERVKEQRDQLKKRLNALKEQFFYQKPEKMLEDMQKVCVPAGVLFDLAIDFGEKYAEKKRSKNLVDFSDLEHMALEILVHRENGENVPTEAALTLAEFYDEIMIDEYQDSNLVQELLLNSVSRIHFGQNNVFMVGDVKQSIYRFRLARPELFTEKYDTYTTEDSTSQKIELHKNFRSRKEVLEPVNYIFRKIMHRDLGNVEYDDNAALYPGAQFPLPEATVETEFTEAVESPLAGAQMLLLELEGGEELLKEAGESDREAEARMIGGKIQELVGKELVYDKEISGYRKVCYKDVVILLRSLSGWAEEFQRVLLDMGIPAYTGTRSGYFSASEVQTVLSILKIIDNPRQDIPFTAVLTSPVGGLDTQSLALIRGNWKNLSFYEACRCYAKENEDETAKKLQQFFVMLERFRGYVPYTPMHELLWKILEETGYMDYASAMPAGGKRRANLEMLVERAAAYESTSYRGLFNFIRYIENLQKYEVDFGEAGTISEEENTVRIMSIHKSKGLEFPVVFVAGLGKKFNQQDSRSALAVHADLGVGCDCVDPKLRVKNATLLKKMIQRTVLEENLGEELRVLYVALTRAKEKLYLTASVKSMEEQRKKWQGIRKERLSFLELTGASSSLEWIWRAVMDEEGYESAIPVTVKSVEDLVRGSAADQNIVRKQKEMLLFGEWREEEGQKKQEEWLDYMTGMKYPWEAYLDTKGKFSVSELKKQSQNIDIEETEELYPEPQIVPLIPNFVEQKEEGGAVRGSATHHVLEKLDFAESDTVAKVQRQLDVLCGQGILAREEVQLVSMPAIVHFFRTDLGKRAAAAQKRGELYRERQFVIGVKASDIHPEWEENETVLIQGIIDAWFEEDGELVVMDYKTDRVYDQGEELLVQRYRTQLDYYAKALEQLTGKRVKEKLIYSFALQKEIAI